MRIFWFVLLVAFSQNSLMLVCADGEIDFNRDIRPILSDTCFQCHGPDEKSREGELRLDSQGGLFAATGDGLVVAPGDVAKSNLFHRITSTDPDLKMPPPDSGRQLSVEQVELVRKWIRQGAKWQQHWSFVAPKRFDLPVTKGSDWCRNPIDHFVLARLEKAGLAPSPTADRATLIRRVTLDLTGLPPSIEEVDAFLTDDSPNAYEKVVDRLLKSPRYGERMAIRWLDAARYADTSGYQSDGPRYMWRWRDWVIDAYNKNMPFDQFTIEQLAGDLLVPREAKRGIGEVGPRAPIIRNEKHLNLLVASAFNRNHRGNAEGGIIPEEYQVEYVVDRVDTTFTTWLGLTMSCARCHDHKYDPISQKDFYQVFAYFNNVPEYGRAIKEGNSPPYIRAPTRQQLQELAHLDAEHTGLVNASLKDSEILGNAQRKWEASFSSEEAIEWFNTEGQVAHFNFDGDARNAASNEVKTEFRDGEATFAKGPMHQSAEFDGSRFVDAGDVANFGYFDSFAISAWVHPTGDCTGTIVSRMAKTQRGEGYNVHLEDGRIQVNLVKRWLDDSIRVETPTALDADRWHHIVVTYDGSRVAKGIEVHVNGQRVRKLNVHHDFLNQTFAIDEPLRIGAGNSNFRGRIDDVRIFRTSHVDHRTLSTPETINEIVEIPRDQRTANQRWKLFSYFLAVEAPPAARERRRLAKEALQRLREAERRAPTLMVMHEMEQPRETFLLERGEYNKRTEKVVAGVPTVFPPLPGGAPKNRLGFAQWLVDASNPLTARVAMNRYWSMYFGYGLVRTLEDFGAQGQRPTHPQLLDWLATEFVRSDWDVKAMQKLIVMSATYRQSSRVSGEMLKLDPDNRFLARAPRLRLSAEMIRDQALAAAGLLHEKLGGPSVKPYQPAGLWQEIATDKQYEQSKAPDLYRRSLYTYWKRTVAPPTMSTFDASAREMCTVRQVRTNTPLQALALMNDVTYIEAARSLAERSMHATDSNLNEAAQYAFRLVLTRQPSSEEEVLLSSALERYLRFFETDPKATAALLAFGDSEANKEANRAKLAALSMVASVILNLDETVTKE